MLRGDQANEETISVLRKLKKRVSELEPFHAECPLDGELEDFGKRTTVSLAR